VPGMVKHPQVELQDNDRTQMEPAGWHKHSVVCSYTGCWEVVVNQLTYIELLLLGGYFGRTFDSVGPHFTEVWIASC